MRASLADRRSTQLIRSDVVDVIRGDSWLAGLQGAPSAAHAEAAVLITRHARGMSGRRRASEARASATRKQWIDYYLQSGASPLARSLVLSRAFRALR